MFYTAEEAAKLIAPYVKMTYGSNNDKLFQLLTLVNDRIWKEGSWHGMSKEFYVRTRFGPQGERYIVPPYGYDVLLALNLDGNPSIPKDKWTQFHKNGYGTVDKSCNWLETALDYGEHATINDIFCEKAANIKPNPIKIGAITLGPEQTAPTVTISGEWDREGPVFTFRKEEISSKRITPVNYEPKTEVVYGAELAIHDTTIRKIDNIYWRSISAIRKTVTANPVEVYAFHSDGTVQLLTKIYPHQTISKNRRYMVPSQCSSSVVHCMFKISEPEEIVSGTQPVLTRNREALISIAMGMNFLYNKEDPEPAAIYIASGFKSLNDEKREIEADEMENYQMVEDPYMDDYNELTRWDCCIY